MTLRLEAPNVDFAKLHGLGREGELLLTGPAAVICTGTWIP